MELSPLAGNRALKTQLSQQEEGRGLSISSIFCALVTGSRQ